MSTLLDLPEGLTRLTSSIDAPAPPESSPPHRDANGFVDCRGVFHAWTEEDA